MTFYLVLSSVGNPDRGEDPRLTVPGVVPAMLAVADLTEVSRRARAHIQNHGLGCGNWPTTRVLDANGVEVGQVSYNGVVWPPGGWSIGVSPLYDPRP